MRFPKQEIDIDAYIKLLSNLLSNEECEIFIDTNIISQLYRLNEDARKDLYRWIDSCKRRFHVPVWSIHEYSKRVYSNATQDYISELGKIKTYSSEFEGIRKFIKAYISSTMLKGTQYGEDKQSLFSDLDTIHDLLAKIAVVIKNNITEHKNKVHEEVIEYLEPCALKTDIYSIMQEADSMLLSRYDGSIPPGFKDGKKDLNSKGDLVIWLEILDFCKKHEVSKAILLTRDRKSDMVYEPMSQKKGNRIASPTERIRLAHESLVYEFNLKTHSNDFYVIDFEILVKLLASKYRELAKSFQISEANEQQDSKEPQLEIDSNSMSSIIEDTPKESTKSIMPTVESNTETPHTSPTEDTEPLYSGIALIDSQYESGNRNASFDVYIEKLTSHDWYIQNPALDKLMGLRELKIEATRNNLDSAFVLGRNILQSAEGSSGSAITFMENISLYIGKWPVKFKQAIIDGMLFEVFFNSKGELRNPPFKASYLDDLMSNIRKLSLKYPFNFINEQINKKAKDQFAPKVGTNDRYLFTFTFDSSQNVDKVECNNKDITSTYPSGNFPSTFAQRDSLRAALSVYYAIPEQNIDLGDIPRNIVSIGTKVVDWISDELPF